MLTPYPIVVYPITPLLQWKHTLLRWCLVGGGGDDDEGLCNIIMRIKRWWFDAIRKPIKIQWITNTTIEKSPQRRLILLHVKESIDTTREIGCSQPNKQTSNYWGNVLSSQESVNETGLWKTLQRTNNWSVFKTKVSNKWEGVLY